MLTITIPAKDYFNDATSEFVTVPEVQLEMEHSLVSLSKWESEFEKPFLGPDEKTTEETFGYIKAMLLTPDVSSEVLDRITNENMMDIQAYIGKKMSATWFSEIPGATRNREIITAEIIYYWMTALTIPFECETWHINRLFTLIKVTNQKNSPAKKMPRNEAAQRMRELNEKRLAESGSKG